MDIDDAHYLSCSDCRMELVQKQWTQLILKWLNRCVHTKSSDVEDLNAGNIVITINKYKDDICADERDYEILCCNDIETFIRYKYPLLRLKYFNETKDKSKKMFLLHSILLYHCCVSSENGMVEHDICTNLSKDEQELILKFCEILTDMEVTAHNVELAIKEAYNSVKGGSTSACSKKIDHDKICCMINSDPSTQSYYSSTEMIASSETMATDTLSPNSAITVAPSTVTKVKKMNTDLNLSSEKPPFITKFEVKSVKDKTPSSSSERCSNDSKSLGKPSKKSLKMKFNATLKNSLKRKLKFKSSVTVLPSTVLTDSYSEIDYVVNFGSCTELNKPVENTSDTPDEIQTEKLAIEMKINDSPGKMKINERPGKMKINERPGKMKINERPVEMTKNKHAVEMTKDKLPIEMKKDEPPTEMTKDKLAIEMTNDKLSVEMTRSEEMTKDKVSVEMTRGECPVEMTREKYAIENTKNNLSIEMTSDKLPIEMKEDCHNKKVKVEDTGRKKPTVNFDESPGLIDVKKSVSDLTGPAGGDRKCNRCKDSDLQSDSDDSFSNYEEDDKQLKYDWRCYKKQILIVGISLLSIGIITGVVVFLWHIGVFSKSVAEEKLDDFKVSLNEQAAATRIFQMNSYICKDGICEKVYKVTSDFIYPSLSRCILLCMGPQVWPHPVGYTYYSKHLVVIASNKLEYKFQSVPSDAVHMYLAEAFKAFLGELAILERYTLDTGTNISRELMIKKVFIEMDVETDPNPRISLDTDESYTLKVETEPTQVVIKLVSASYCGMRHALETLGQLILLDQSTGNLITLTNMIIKDAPSYKYRGLMLDTGRNYIPVPDIMRTIDAMASVKLNTFHWRISDVTSFPLQLTAVPQLFEYGSYGRSLVYTKDDVKKIVRRAGIRGIRVLLEVAVPGPVGRAWSWMPEATCPSKDKNFTCNNILCLRLGTKDTVFDILQIIYAEILEMTKVHDIFHLSDSVFSLINCFYLMEDREGFLEKALERLKMANRGVLPQLPIIWYTTHLMKDIEARSWDRYGVQLTEWQPNPTEQFLTRFKVIHSSRWDLSCEIKKQRCNKYRTWQDMYTWKSWKTLDVFTIMGGEAILWTDLVDSGNIDYHLWPRTAAVAERLWSDAAINGTVTSPVYVRLDNQRWRMVLKSVQVQPIWPLYCSFSPGVCLQKIKYR